MSLQGAAGKLWHSQAGAKGAQAPAQGRSEPGPGPRWDEHHAPELGTIQGARAGLCDSGEQDSTHPEPAPVPWARAAPRPMPRATAPGPRSLDSRAGQSGRRAAAKPPQSPGPGPAQKQPAAQRAPPWPCAGAGTAGSTAPQGPAPAPPPPGTAAPVGAVQGLSLQQDEPLRTDQPCPALPAPTARVPGAAVGLPSCGAQL